MFQAVVCIGCREKNFNDCSLLWLNGSFSVSTCHQIFHVLPGIFLGPPVCFGLGSETVECKKENLFTLQLYNYRGTDKFK